MHFSCKNAPGTLQCSCSLFWITKPADDFIALFNLAKIANFTSDEVNSYLNELVMDNDYWNTLVYAREEALQDGIAEGRAEGIAKGRAEGIAEGRAEGIAKGRAEGIAEGRAEGIAKGRAETIKKMLEAGVPVEIIANALGITLEECAAIGR